MASRILRATLCFALFGALVFTPAAAAEKERTVNIDIKGPNGGSLSLSFPAEIVSGFLEGLGGGILCDAELDGELLEMLEHLDRGGKRSRYELEGDDGEVIRARRRKGQLEIDILQPGEPKAHVSMPWAIAECFLGRDVDILAAGENLKVEIEQEGSIRIHVD